MFEYAQISGFFFICGVNWFWYWQRWFGENLKTLNFHSFIFIYQEQLNSLFSICLGITRKFLARRVTMELVKFFALISQLLSNLSSHSDIKKRQNRCGDKTRDPLFFIVSSRITFLAFTWTGDCYIIAIIYLVFTIMPIGFFSLKMYVYMYISSRYIYSLYWFWYHWLSIWICQENLYISRFHKISIWPPILGSGLCFSTQQYDIHICIKHNFMTKF